MARPPAKSPFALLALGLWILACPPSLARTDGLKALNQQVTQLIEQGKYQEAFSIAQRAATDIDFPMWVHGRLGGDEASRRAAKHARRQQTQCNA
jgi:hypothetical protein